MDVEGKLVVALPRAHPKLRVQVVVIRLDGTRKLTTKNRRIVRKIVLLPEFQDTKRQSFLPLRFMNRRRPMHDRLNVCHVNNMVIMDSRDMANTSQ